ncbi:MAG: hypothetical protein RMX96_31255 [Nostoc sp. ChiSLP02]|nr:hypothetical protein [Nostoc sp. DedSLP05]MDZ8101209.1 hypothetical protein [Nostoc sp. DedSLP01]MDZ8189304.1 hypothetical protein [Nostoc sp. ChiSLP02]
MTKHYKDKLVLQVNNEEVILPEAEIDEIIFKVSGEQYLKYIQWKRKIEERIIIQELETGKRFFDGEKLSQNQLSKIRKQLETGQQVEVYYGTVEEGYVFLFYPTSIINIVKIKNTLTGDEIDLTDYDNL